MSRPDAAMLTASLMVRKGAAQPSRLFTLPTPVAPSRPAPSAPPSVSTTNVAATNVAAARAPTDVSAKDRRRLTLRLDPDRHLRLKLAAAHRNLSLQELLLAALDSHLAREAPCACLASESK